MRERMFAQELFSQGQFSDKFLEDASNGIDVIMPIMNTNIFFESNILSIYRELPVSRLIVGNGGSTDGSLEILARFPRTTILDQRSINTLGGCIKQLVDEVSSKYFAYLHSDVYLPEGINRTYSSLELQNAWIESSRNTLIVHEQTEIEMDSSSRSYSGFQIGSSSLLKEALSVVEDDYLYRNEDIVISELVSAAGGKYIKQPDLVHLHQAVSKNIENEPSVRAVITRESDPEWEKNTANLQYKGLVKYLNPSSVTDVNVISQMIDENLKILSVLQSSTWKQSRKWIADNNPDWLPYLKSPSILSRIKFLLKKSSTLNKANLFLKGRF